VKASVTDTAEQRRLVEEWKTTHAMPRATIKQVADHIEHVRQVAGVDHVGIGSDFDGTPTMPEGLEDVSRYPVLLEELASRGYGEEDLTKIAGRNVLRVMREGERTRTRLRVERSPSKATIEELDTA
jgi:membrane dipeptidase